MSEDWQGQAACRTEPPQRFTDPDDRDIGLAKKVCQRCDVRQQCLDVALRHDPASDAGIWGGTTEQERQQLRRGEPARTRPIQTAAPAPAIALPPTPETAPVSEPVRRYDQPRLTVARYQYGDFTDATGRVIIFRLPNDRDWMLMVDGCPHARTRTIGEAQHAAWEALNSHRTRHNSKDTYVLHPHREGPEPDARRCG